MKKFRKNIIRLLLITLIFTYFISPWTIVNATTLDSDTLLIAGGVTVTKQTTIDDVISQYGEQPKLVTPTPLGGNAYTFYKGNYEDILYFETLNNGTIFAYGAITDDFKSNYYSYGESVSGTYSYLSGDTLEDYNYNAIGIITYRNDLDTYNIVNNYKTEYFKDQSQYEKYNAMHATLMANHFYIEDGVTVEFNEDVYDTLKKMEDNEVQTQDILSNYANEVGKNAYIKVLGGRTVDTSIFYKYLPNPFSLVDSVKNYRPTDDKNILYYSFHVYNRDNLTVSRQFSYFVSSKIVEKIANDVSLTEEEKALYEQARDIYNESVETFNQSNGFVYQEEPVYNTLPLQAGVIYPNILQGTTMFINSIRAGAGLPLFQLDEDLSDIAQHKSTLIAYINAVDDTGNENNSMHYPNLPAGVDEDFYNRAMERMTGENLYDAGLSQSPITSISNALNDAYGDPIEAGHRYNLLDPNFTNFGFGMTEGQAVHRFTGYQTSDVDIVAWPSKGVMPVEGFSGGYWTTRFYNNYIVTNDSTVTIKRLNDNREWNFTEEITTGNHRFKIGNGMVSFYNPDLVSGNNYIYEITVHNVRNLETDKIEDYTYRSVFKKVYSTGEEETDEIYPTSISTDIDEYTGEVGDIKVIDVTFGNNPAEKLLKFTSSNPWVADVNQYGRVELKNPGTATITIETLNGLKEMVTINVNGELNYLMGDMNNSGRIDITDITVLVKVLYGMIDTNDYYLAVGDMNHSGRLDITDITVLVKTLYGLI